MKWNSKFLLTVVNQCFNYTENVLSADVQIWKWYKFHSSQEWRAF